MIHTMFFLPDDDVGIKCSCRFLWKRKCMVVFRSSVFLFTNNLNYWLYTCLAWRLYSRLIILCKSSDYQIILLWSSLSCAWCSIQPLSGIYGTCTDHSRTCKFYLCSSPVYWVCKKGVSYIILFCIYACINPTCAVFYLNSIFIPLSYESNKTSIYFVSQGHHL